MLNVITQIMCLVRPDILLELFILSLRNCVEINHIDYIFTWYYTLIQTHFP